MSLLLVIHPSDYEICLEVIVRFTTMRINWCFWSSVQQWFAIFVCIGEILLIMANRATGRRLPYGSKARTGPRGTQAVRMTHFCHQTSAPYGTQMELHSCSAEARFADKLRDVKRFCSGVMRFDRETTVRLPATICERREDLLTNSNSFNGQNHSVFNKAPSLSYVQTRLFRLIFAGKRWWSGFDPTCILALWRYLIYSQFFARVCGSHGDRSCNTNNVKEHR